MELADGGRDMRAQVVGHKERVDIDYIASATGEKRARGSGSPMAYDCLHVGQKWLLV